MPVSLLAQLRHAEGRQRRSLDAEADETPFLLLPT